MMYPRVLVISNNGFSLSNSNGRTLGMLFEGWPKDKLAQFCFNTNGPYWEICDNYFAVSDKAALRSFLTFSPAPREDFRSWGKTQSSSVSSIPRNALFSLLRHIVWSSGLWRGKEFKNWIDNFAPEIVVIQSGDMAFTHTLASKIARKYGAKLVFFNTEGTFFLSKNYLYKGPLDFILFPMYKRIHQRAYEQAMSMASYAIYHHEMIQRDNDRKFHVPGCVVHTSTTLKRSMRPFKDKCPVISYFGNFAYGRDNALVEVGNFLQKISPDLVVRVYGKANQEQSDKFNSASGISYKGFVPYDEIKLIISDSDILLYVESQDEYFAENLRYGFSTKIADCLASGKSFVVYSSSDIACANYLKENNCAWVTYDEESFIDAIRSIISDAKKREEVIERGLKIADVNHNLSKNVVKFQSALVNL